MSPTLHHRSVTAGFSGPHHSRRPSVLEHGVDWFLLLIVAVGDFANFSIVIARAEDQLSWTVAMTLTLAMTAAAVLLMHKAGTIRRQLKANVSAMRPAVVWILVLLWLALGVVAFWLRVTSETAGTTGGFGSAEATGSSTDIPFAVIMLVVYLAGGAAAYTIGFASHNPLRSDLVRAQRRHWWATRRLNRAVRKQIRAGGGSGVEQADAELALRLAEVDSGAERLRAEARPLLASARVHVLVAQEQEARRDLDAAREAYTRTDSALHDLDDELDPMRQEESLAQTLREIDAQARQLKELVRHQMAMSLGDPGATSGLFADTTGTTETDPATGRQQWTTR